MSQDFEPPDLRLDAPTAAELEALELFRRSPHPYLRHRNEVRKFQLYQVTPPSPPSQSSTRSSSGATRSGTWRKHSTKSSHSLSESGTEADDEGYSLVRALPAPPLRLHKGLRDSRGSVREDRVSPLLTPSQIDEEGRKFSNSFFDEQRKRASKGGTLPTDEETRTARRKYFTRRRHELFRRTTETALLAGVGILAIRGCNCWKKLLVWHRTELTIHAIIIVGALAAYLLRLFHYSWRKGSNLALRHRIHLPAAFDPATVLYPPILPVLISASLFTSYPKPFNPNVLLGLAALPPRLVPYKSATLGYSNLHWLVSILPIAAAECIEVNSSMFASNLQISDPQLPNVSLHREQLVTLFPLHQALLPPLHYLTTTSLLPAELHLLSIGLINILLLSSSPQANILKLLMWMGGISVFISCAKILEWGVALARIPFWRLRPAGQATRTRKSFLQILNESLKRDFIGPNNRGNITSSDADEEDPIPQTSFLRTKSLGLNISDAARSHKMLPSVVEPHPTLETTKSVLAVSEDRADELPIARKRSNTLPTMTANNHSVKIRYPQHKRSKSTAQTYLSLTANQVIVRKWLFAGYFYLAVIVLILGPVRYAISKSALQGHEPFGWAISYLLGNVPMVRWETINWNLERWIPLPPLLSTENQTVLSQRLPLAEYLRYQVIGEANTRLLLCIYCAGIIVAGLLSVFSLSAVVEVDTRRKVFHGTMVAMLLPTIFIDPCFIALALALVLAVFLLLDLIRASQLPPLSKPIAKFLTPYVDGRDLRGPVVVSHIFLLIGCAIPLWLSLAAIERSGDGLWQGWEVKTRDVSMVAGVVCVGLGDAAASLVGRRYGRRKWPWAGGKSLEGSLAFAGAVVVGLLVGKVWLHFGWEVSGASDRPVMAQIQDVIFALGKAALCAAGASLNEAALTGGNDNVIVPIILWVLVRGVRL